MASKRNAARKAPEPSYEPTWDPETGPTDDQVNTALRVLRADYWTSVRSFAKDLVRRVRAGEIDRETGLSDAIHETCDGSSWCIYTAESQRAVLCSDHDPSEDAEDMGAESLTDGQRAYFCLVHDVTAQCEAIFDTDAGE